MENKKQQKSPNKWPDILQRYVDEVKPPEIDLPRITTRRFHGREVPLWFGKVHIDDVHGYVDNLRLKFYLNRWLVQKGIDRAPSTDEIYEIMIEADREEPRLRVRPFHIERIANNIVRNNVREPIILYYAGDNSAELWDGNRRFYALKHIMNTDMSEYIEARSRLQWVPAYVFMTTDNTEEDLRVKHDILVECNFVSPEQIPWPNFVKAEEIHYEYQKRMSIDPDDPTLRREVKVKLAEEYGLRGWRTADRWIKMYDLALQFKEYQEEDREQDSTNVDLLVQEKFEYFDELSKAGVLKVLKEDLDVRDKVFDWLWDRKFKAFTDVRQIPKIVADPVAWKQANEPSDDSVKQAIITANANDPARLKDKTAANEKIKQFAAWLDSFRREEYKTLNEEALDSLQTIVRDAFKITKALLSKEEVGTEEDNVAAEEIEEGTTMVKEK